MNIKIALEKMELLIDKHYPIAQVSGQVGKLGQKAQLIMPEPQVGNDYLQWSLPGDGWTSLDDAGDYRPAVESAYAERRNRMKSAFGQSKIREAVLSIPSTHEIYYRRNGQDLEIALVAWGHKFHNKPACGELSTNIRHNDLQAVSIGFVWNGEQIPQLPFTLAGQPRRTGDDGLFHVDKPLPVGKCYEVGTTDGRPFPLTVEKGKAVYLNDLTTYLTAEVTVEKDGQPLPGTTCTLTYGNHQATLTTNELGRAEATLPHNGEGGKPSPIQPEVAVSCGGEQQQTPAGTDGERLTFLFTFASEQKEDDPIVEPEPPVEEEEEPGPEYVTIELKDYEGFPLVDLPFTLHTKLKGDVALTTNDKGICEVEKTWFTPKEKCNVSFSISPEYQATHDIHLEKKKKKDK